MPTSTRKMVVASLIGTTIEWYDHFIFVLGTGASALISSFFRDALLTWEQQE